MSGLPGGASVRFRVRNQYVYVDKLDTNTVHLAIQAGCLVCLNQDVLIDPSIFSDHFCMAYCRVW